MNNQTKVLATDMELPHVTPSSPGIIPSAGLYVTNDADAFAKNDITRMQRAGDDEDKSKMLAAINNLTDKFQSGTWVVQKVLSKKQIHNRAKTKAQKAARRKNR